MSYTHFMRLPDATANVSSNRLACRFHPEQPLVVNERGDEQDGRTIVVYCPICMHLAHSHEERERASMTLSTDPHSIFGRTSRSA